MACHLWIYASSNHMGHSATVELYLLSYSFHGVCDQLLVGDTWNSRGFKDFKNGAVTGCSS